EIDGPLDVRAAGDVPPLGDVPVGRIDAVAVGHRAGMLWRGGGLGRRARRAVTHGGGRNEGTDGQGAQTSGLATCDSHTLSVVPVGPRPDRGAWFGAT